MTRGERFAELRKRKGFSQQSLAAEILVTDQSISNYETGLTSRMQARAWRRVAEAFKMSVEELNERVGDGDGVDENVTPYSERTVPADVPTFDLGVAAGGWVDVNDNEDGAGSRVTPAQRARGLFDVYVRGDSMEPRVKDGARVRFKLLELPNSTSPACDDIVIGKLYYVQLDDGRATFKRAAACADGVLTLQAENRKYKQPLKVEMANIARLAVALHVIDDL
jgi:transcriptional regulator with XRE-family HTH domain